MNNINSLSAVSAHRRFILWRQVLSLAGLQAAIILSWVVYRAYLPKLFSQFGFSSTLAATVLLIESALGVGLEPFFGALSDRQKQMFVTRFPLISFGVVLSSVLFILIPCFVLFVIPSSVSRVLLFLLLISWSLAMATFRAPMLALLGKFASVTELPRALSCLALAGGLISALAPISQDFLLSLGAVVAFSTGSIILLIAVFVLRSFTSEIETIDEPFTADKLLLDRSFLAHLLLIFSTGFCMGGGTTFLMSSVPKFLKIAFVKPPFDIKLFMLAVGVALAIAALPAGFLASRLGIKRGILTGICSAILALLLLSGNSLLLPLLIVSIIAGVSLVNVSAIPFAVASTPSQQSGVAIGSYFGGFSAAAALLPWLLGPVDKIALSQAIAYGVITFTFGGVLIALSGNFRGKTEPFLNKL